MGIFTPSPLCQQRPSTTTTTTTMSKLAVFIALAALVAVTSATWCEDVKAKYDSTVECDANGEYKSVQCGGANCFCGYRMEELRYDSNSKPWRWSGQDSAAEAFCACGIKDGRAGKATREECAKRAGFKAKLL